MTKQEQIEEMAQIICGRSKDDICIIDNTSCDSICRWARDAEAIYNAGYRKVDEVCKETAKEFAEKLKIKAIRLSEIENYHVCNLIDELLKEYEK